MYSLAFHLIATSGHSSKPWLLYIPSFRHLLKMYKLLWVPLLITYSRSDCTFPIFHVSSYSLFWSFQNRKVITLNILENNNVRAVQKEKFQNVARRNENARRLLQRSSRKSTGRKSPGQGGKNIKFWHRNWLVLRKTWRKCLHKYISG